MESKQTPETRIYHNEELALNKVITINKEESHHLVNVLKLKNNDFISLFNASCGEWLAKITQAHKNATEVIICYQIKKTEDISKKINLYYAPLKNTASSILLEKITEIGVTSITQVITDKTTNKPIATDKMVLKLKKAVQQCGRLSFPTINTTIQLTHLLNSLTHTVIWLNERQTGDSLATLLQNYKDDTISFLIGPEGGFSVNEQDMLSKSPHILQSFLQGNILRAETAGIAAVTLASYI